MNKECENCIKRKTMWCPPSCECMALDELPYQLDKISALEKIDKLEQENKQLKRDINIMQNYLQLIIDIGYDYEGYNDVKNLKELIDELCKYALYGKNLDDKKIVASSCEIYYNILGEEILGDKE